MKKFRAIGFWLLATTAPVFGADLYQWTDGRGVVHFSDNPQAVPKKIRDSAEVKVRKDFFSAAPEFFTAPKKPLEVPLSASKADAPGAQEPAATAPAPGIDAPPVTTVVVINNAGHQHRLARHHPCRGEPCAPAFRPDFNQRQYIHPSAFSGGARQYIRP